MPTKEMQLISRIIRSGDLSSVLELGITPDDFLTAEGRGMFNHILGYFSRPDTAGAVFGPNVVQGTYPMFVLCDDESMTTEALCVEVRKDRLAASLRSRAQGMLDLIDSDVMQAASYGQTACNEIINIGLGKETDIYLSNAVDHIINKYDQKKAGVDFSICPWPWDPLQYVTGGIQPDDYIVFYGRPKSMKSWVLAALVAWAYEKGKKAVIYTKEMSWENIFMRVLACLSSIEYHGLRMGTLSDQEEEALRHMQRLIHYTQEDQNLICLSAKDAPAGGDNVPWLRSKIEKHRPEICFIDGMYLMTDVNKARKREERITNISRATRQMVLDTGVPVIATFQANRGAAGHSRGELDEIMYSDAIGQDATIAARVINDKATPTISLVMAGSREFELDGFRIFGMPAVNFEFHSMLSAKEIEKAKELDSTPEDRSNKPRKMSRNEEKIIKAATQKLQNLI